MEKKTIGLAKPKQIAEDGFKRKGVRVRGGPPAPKAIIKNEYGKSEAGTVARPPKEARKPFDPDRKPFDRERKPFDPDRKPFDRERKPFDPDRKPYDRERKPFDPDRKPYDRERRPFDRERKPFDSDRKPFDRERKPFDPTRKPFDRERKPFDPDRKPFDRERKPFDPDRKPFDRERKPFDPDRKPFDRERKPFDPTRKPFDRERKLFDPDRKPFDRERNPFDPDRKPFDRERKPFDPDRKPFDRERKPFDPDRKPFDRERKPFDPDRKPFDRERKPFDKSSRGEDGSSNRNTPSNGFTGLKLGPNNSIEGAQHYFIPCPRGLENVLRKELLDLKAQGIETAPGGVSCVGSELLGYEISLHSRVASRVLWQVGYSKYLSDDDLYYAAKRLPWHQLFAVNRSFRVQLTSINSELQSLNFATLKVKDGVVDRFRDETGNRPDVNTSTPDVRIHVFLRRDEALFYYDLSGEALFKRNYRSDGLTAPLRENLAAGILRLIEWDPATPLLDPMCGSGTFLTEAAMIASNTPAGLNRHHGLERLLTWKRDQWFALKDAARAHIKREGVCQLFGFDQSEAAIAQTRAHLTELGMSQCATLEQKNVLDMQAPTPQGVWLCNPPYGIRLGDEAELKALYPKLSEVMKHRFVGWDTYFITADLDLPAGLHLKASRKTPLRNGALDCRLFGFPMMEGSLRPEK
jgi:putative N6-adenine-specific DNA methylase